MFDPQTTHAAARWCWLHKLEFLARWLQRLNFFFTTCELPYTVQIGKRVRFQHYGCGVMVYDWTIIGDDVLIHPHVVIGGVAHDNDTVPGKSIIIGDGAQLGAGAKIISSDSLEIGKRALIGANAVVLHSVPDDCTAVGIPARILPPKKSRATPAPHLPNP